MLPVTGAEDKVARKRKNRNLLHGANSIVFVEGKEKRKKSSSYDTYHLDLLSRNYLLSYYSGVRMQLVAMFELRHTLPAAP